MRNNQGSILFALAISTLAAFMIVIFGFLFHEAMLSQKRSAVKLSAIAYIANLRSTLQEASICENLLRGQFISGVGGTINRNSLNENLVIGQNTPDFFPYGVLRANNNNISKDFTIEKITLSVNQFDILRTDGASIDHYLRVLHYDRPGKHAEDFYTYQVRINFAIKARGFLNYYLYTGSIPSQATNALERNRAPEFYIDLIANVDSNGQIFTCHGLDHPAEACEMAGGAYDASDFMNPWPHLRCHPTDSRCWIDREGFRYTAARPFPQTPQVADCPWPYKDANWAGRTGGQDRWICQWCNNRLWEPPNK